MAEDARFAYLQARLQARHGDRPAADDWRIAEASIDLSHYLDAVRRTALRRWVGDINHEMDAEAIERQLRAAWRAAVDEAASWSPQPWRAAVSWMRWLPDLPAVDHLLRGTKVPPWMRADPVLRDVAFDEPQRRRDALAESPLAPLPPDDGPADAGVADAWMKEWRARLPAAGPDDKLEAILDAVQAHVETMRSATDGDGQALRHALAAILARRFRRGAGSSVALFAHLLLDGLELERLRAGLITRRVLPQRAEGRTWA